MESQAAGQSPRDSEKYVKWALPGLLVVLALGYLATGAKPGTVNARIYWQPVDGGIDGNHSTTFSLTADGDWHLYEIEIPASEIVRVRIDPAAGGDIVREASIRDARYHPVVPADTAGIPLPPSAWNTFNATPQVENEVLKIENPGEDPYILTHRFSPANSDHISFSAKIEPRRLSPWRWIWRDPG